MKGKITVQIRNLNLYLIEEIVSFQRNITLMGDTYYTYHKLSIELDGCMLQAHVG